MGCLVGLGLFLERFRFHCSLEFISALILLSAHVDIFLTAQCDLFRLAEAERGAAQSKATKLVVCSFTVQVRSRAHATFQRVALNRL